MHLYDGTKTRINKQKYIIRINSIKIEHQRIDPIKWGN